MLSMQSLSERVSALEDDQFERAKPKGPEPILTCVQCLSEYKESENAGIHYCMCELPNNMPNSIVLCKELDILWAQI